MGVKEILILILIALISRLFFSGKGRVWSLYVLSILVVYWLQPLTPIRYLDYWLPTLTFLLIFFSWLAIIPKTDVWNRQNQIAIGLMVLTSVLVALTRYISLEGILTASRPPAIEQIVVVFLILGGMAWVIWRFEISSKINIIITIIIIIIFLVIKTPLLSTNASIFLRMLGEQNTASASALDLRWLGISYIAFRLIHTLRDARTRRLPAVSLPEYLVYVLFFPAVTAGPIDRVERFVGNLRQPYTGGVDDVVNGGKRLALGLVKKFVIADSLALVALSTEKVFQIQSAGWAWVILYAYSLQIFFDFSGYTDIAIGLGNLLGIQLPENFNSPYTKRNLSLFWNNWHMTLTQWFRAYFFNPLTRSLRKSSHPLPAGLVIFITQVSTMMLIGLWHGVTWNFVLWGLWHGLGLFIQNRWSEWSRPRLSFIQDHGWLDRIVSGVNVLLTFHFVSLGWIWFAIPDPRVSLSFFNKLFGL